jgi:Cell wall synthesis protein CwsA
MTSPRRTKRSPTSWPPRRKWSQACPKRYRRRGGRNAAAKRPLLIAGVVVAVLAGGAAAFSIVRRSSRAEPSPRPPSVDVQPLP